MLSKQNGVELLEISVYSNPSAKIEDLDTETFFKLHTQARIDRLDPGNDYQLQSKFCNQLTCVTSSRLTSFRTVQNDRIEYFECENINSTSLLLFWSFRISEARAGKSRVRLE